MLTLTILRLLQEVGVAGPSSTLAIPISAAAAVVGGIIAYLVSQKVKVWDKHVEECNQTPKILIMNELKNINAGMGRIETGMAAVTSTVAQHGIDIAQIKAEIKIVENIGGEG